LDHIIKVNVDGSSLSNPRRLGFGGLIRNNNGDWFPKKIMVVGC